MDPNLFISRKQPDWNELERLLGLVEGKRFNSLTAKQAHDLGRLYRRASSDLATAKAHVASEEVVLYLNGLVARAFATLYSVPRLAGWRRLWPFLRRRFPALLRGNLGAMTLSAAVFFAAASIGFVAYRLDPNAAGFFRPQKVESLDEQLKKGKIGTNLPVGYAPVFSAKIMTNNIRVSFMAFALGLTFGIGTFLVLFYNGLMLGAYAGVAHKNGMAFDFWAYILPHGVIELTAIIVAGGAGFMLGRALLLPGPRSRRRALKALGGDAVSIIYGLLPLFVIAGLIEGFITPWKFLSPQLKLLVAALTVAPLAWYLIGTLRSEERDRASP